MNVNNGKKLNSEVNVLRLAAISLQQWLADTCLFSVDRAVLKLRTLCSNLILLKECNIIFAHTQVLISGFDIVIGLIIVFIGGLEFRQSTFYEELLQRLLEDMDIRCCRTDVICMCLVDLPMERYPMNFMLMISILKHGKTKWFA